MEAGTGEAASGKTIRPLDAFERRVLGVLIEKAKTTPDQYPLSLNGVVTGCNQKSNRDPVMTVDEEQAARALEGLRKCGAAAEVFGSGKLPRYRHLAYEWLGVGKEELGIMGELLLRGEQTEGDLRGRASRMDPIPDLDTLRVHLDRLAERGLVIWLEAADHTLRVVRHRDISGDVGGERGGEPRARADDAAGPVADRAPGTAGRRSPCSARPSGITRNRCDRERENR